MKKNISFGATMEYNEKQGSELLAVNNLVGSLEDYQNGLIKPWEYEQQVTRTQSLYEGWGKKKVAHVIMSPHIKEGQKLSAPEWKSISEDFLKRSGLDKHQSLVYLHKDKEHYHLHIVANKIDSAGNMYNAHQNEATMSQKIGNDIAKERGLTQAGQILKEKSELRQQPGRTELKTLLIDTADSVKARNGGLFQSEEFISELQAQGHKVKTFRGEDGTLKGYGIEKDGSFYLSSRIGKEFTLQSFASPTTSNSKTKLNQYERKRDLTEFKKPPSRLSQMHRLSECDSVFDSRKTIKNLLSVNALDKLRLNARGRDTDRLQPIQPTIANKKPSTHFTVTRYENGQKKSINIPLTVQEQMRKDIAATPFRNAASFKEGLEKKGYSVDMDTAKKRYSLTKDGYTLYASEIGREFSLTSLEKDVENQPPQQNTTSDLLNKASSLLSNIGSDSEPTKKPKRKR